MSIFQGKAWRVWPGEALPGGQCPAWRGEARQRITTISKPTGEAFQDIARHGWACEAWLRHGKAGNHTSILNQERISNPMENQIQTAQCASSGLMTWSQLNLFSAPSYGTQAQAAHQ